MKSLTVVLAAVVFPAAMEAAGPLSYYSVTPCRLVDTRGAPGPFGSPALTASVQRNFSVAGYCGVPSDALAVQVNAAVVSPSAPGHLILWQYGQGQPLVSNINFNAFEAALANGALVPMNPGLTLNISVVSAASTHLILDVVGYYRQYPP